MAQHPRIEDLLAAVDDVIVSVAAPPRRYIGDASPAHRERFDRYVRQLHRAKQMAEEWWNGLIDSEIERVKDPVQAEINVTTRRTAGPVVNPSVIHCIRSAWLDCQRLNADQPNPVAPEAFVLLWLAQAGERTLANFVGTLPYWPLALDEDGRWT